ncbi:hypothetical protein HDU97_006792, partial [Phlyctochytrium planicorne]
MAGATLFLHSNQHNNNNHINMNAYESGSLALAASARSPSSNAQQQQSSWLSSLAAKARKPFKHNSHHHQGDESSAVVDATTIEERRGNRKGQVLLPLAIPMLSTTSKRAVAGLALHSPTAWSHAFPSSSSSETPAGQVSSRDSRASLDEAQTPTQRTIGTFSDQLSARQFADITKMEVAVWDDADEDDNMSIPDPALHPSPSVPSLVDSDAESMRNMSSNHSTVSSTSSILSTSSRGSGPRLD